MREISIAFQTNKRASDYVTLAKHVNQYDFAAVSVYCDAPYHPSYGPLILMAPHIHRARLGSAAVSPARMAPIDIAADAALLDDMAHAGTYLGISRGAWLSDHGISEPSKPIQAIRETIEIVRALWRGDSASYHGQVYQIAAHVKAGYPLPQRPIPIMVGSWGAKLCAVAGELADEVKVGGSANPDVVAHIRDYIAVGERSAQRPLGSVGIALGAVTVVDDDRQAARHKARQAAVLYLPVVAPLDPSVQIDPELIQRLQTHADSGDFAGGAALISDDILDRFAFSGDAHDIIAQCERLFAAGVTRIEFGTPHGLVQAHTGIDIIGKQVIPALMR
ncbi:MAG: LLM class flavin-dependent oxidoreductase [Chloroflexaceae bacterium]|jgi:5,10-methylenetetrahydromethanopterin reductase|nr:LLM class flavin-dependent oxidoreductase [Chloroflexaceae bacterium]